MRKHPLKQALLLGMICLLSSCGAVVAPVLTEERPQLITPEVSALSLPTLDFTLPYYPEESLHPTIVQNQTNSLLAPLLYESLYVLDPGFNPQPLLVATEEMSEDGYRWIFTIHQNVQFWDGTNLTGSMVASALNEARGSRSKYASRLEDITSITGSGYQITIQLSAPNINLPALLDVPISYGGGNLPQGTGPYTIENNHLALQWHWWQLAEKPVPEQILLKPLHGEEDLQLAFNAGQISLMRGDLTGNTSLGFSGNYEVWDYPTPKLVFLGCSQNSGLTANLRQLLSEAIQRETLVSQTLAGYGNSVTLPLHGYNDTSAWLDPYVYDPLMMANKVSSTYIARGIFPLTLIVNGENPVKVAMAERIAQQLSEFGLSIEVKELALRDYELALEYGNFDLFLAEIYLTPDFDVSDLFFASGAYNYGGYENARLEELWQQYRRYGTGIFTLDEEGEAMEHFFSAFQTEMPFIPLCFRTEAMMTMWGHIQNASPTASHLFYQLEHWNISGGESQQ